MARFLSVFGYPLGDFLGCLFKLGEKFFGTNISKSHINLQFEYFIAPAALAESICNVLQQSLGFVGFCEVVQSFPRLCPGLFGASNFYLGGSA